MRVVSSIGVAVAWTVAVAASSCTTCHTNRQDSTAAPTLPWPVESAIEEVKDLRAKLDGLFALQRSCVNLAIVMAQRGRYEDEESQERTTRMLTLIAEQMKPLQAAIERANQRIEKIIVP